jgi:hypothetical protein
MQSYKLHPFAVSPRIVSSVLNARVERFDSTFGRAPYWAVVADQPPNEGYVSITGCDEATAVRLLTPVCDALNAHDFGTVCRMQLDMLEGDYERNLNDYLAHRAEAPPGP